MWNKVGFVGSAASVLALPVAFALWYWPRETTAPTSLPTSHLSPRPTLIGANTPPTGSKRDIPNSSKPLAPKKTASTNRQPKLVVNAPVQGSVIVSEGQVGGQIAHIINNHGAVKRAIPPAVREHMLKTLRAAGPNKIGFASTQGDSDAYEFKASLIEIFKEAGWDVHDMETFMFFGEHKGFVITIPFQSSEAGLPQTGAQVLALTGNPIAGNRGDMANECGIYVQVWHAP